MFRIPRLALLALALVIASRPLAAADDTYTIKFKELGKGETGSYDVTEKMELFVQLANAGGEKFVDVLAKADVKTVFWQRVLEKPDGEPPTRVLRGYGEARLTLQGEKTILPFEGKHVRMERKGNKTSVVIDGVKEGAGKHETLLRAEVVDSLSMSAFLPRKPVKLKESYRFDGKPLADYIRARVKDVQFDLTKLDGIGRLTEVSEKDGKPFAKVVTYLEIPIKSVTADGKKYLMRAGDKMVMQINFDICMDGSTHVGTVKVVPYISLNAGVEAEGQKVTMKLVYKGERTVTIRPGVVAK
jgi:hypothetical protein